MSDPGSTGTPRPLSELLLAGLGWASVGVEAVDGVADDLARRVGIDRAEMRAALRDAVNSWRNDAERLGLRKDDATDRLLERAGLARREELEELGLRIAQLEHRLKLLENHIDGAS